MFTDEISTTVEVEFRGKLLELEVYAEIEYDLGYRNCPDTLFITEIWGLHQGKKAKRVSERLYHALRDDFDIAFEDELIKSLEY